MKTSKPEEFLFEAAKVADNTHYVLRLCVAGTTLLSTRAILNIKQICEEHLKGRYTLEVIDVYQQRTRAVEEQVIAAPTLIKKEPLPVCRLIGDMSNTARVLTGLNLLSKP